MKKNIRSILQRYVFAAGKALLLAGLCVLSAFVTVFPIWKFATTFPAAYTAAALAIGGIFLAIVIIQRLRNIPALRILRSLLIFAIVLGTLILAVRLAASGRRIPAFGAIAASPILGIALSLLIRDHDKRK